MSPYEFTIWITSSEARYGAYIGFDNKDYIWKLPYEDRLNFLLLIWNSEGCPDI